jgi:hypothetical protein
VDNRCGCGQLGGQEAAAVALDDDELDDAEPDEPLVDEDEVEEDDDVELLSLDLVSVLADDFLPSALLSVR